MRTRDQLIDKLLERALATGRHSPSVTPLGRSVKAYGKRLALTVA